MSARWLTLAARQNGKGGLTITEDDLKRAVIDTAKIHGWRVHHSRPARTQNGWRTPVEGHAGLPDLVLARDGQVLLVELKSDTGRTTADQEKWLAAAGGQGRLWRPRHWPEILVELSAPRRSS